MRLLHTDINNSHSIYFLAIPQKDSSLPISLLLPPTFYLCHNHSHWSESVVYFGGKSEEHFSYTSWLYVCCMLWLFVSFVSEFNPTISSLLAFHISFHWYVFLKIHVSMSICTCPWGKTVQFFSCYILGKSKL